jgi:biofilm PGA synthesis N-glycosyltransferase PgaC
MNTEVSRTGASLTYVAITPARDEELLLPGLISSMEAQTHRPARWIIIDDGSVDRTAEIAEEAARTSSWIEVHHLERKAPRAPGGESVIMRFFPREQWSKYNFILRLDADLTFGPDMVALLIEEFQKDAELGIAGAVLYEPFDSGWREIPIPSFHTRGAAKMYSSQCFAAIGGLQSGIGWDTIDEAQAMMLGFRTRNFRHIHAYHHRPQGRASGVLRGRFSTGRTAYVIGYSPSFMLARAVRRLMGSPPILGSVFLMLGFLDGYVRRLPRAASPELIRFIRRQQRRRLLMLDSLWQ